MNGYDQQTSTGAIIPNCNSIMTNDGLVTIKQEPECIEEETFHFETPLPPINQVPIINQETVQRSEDKIKLKNCYIRLEKCDKIWETLKVIKNLQTPGSINSQTSGPIKNLQTFGSNKNQISPLSKNQTPASKNQTPNKIQQIAGTTKSTATVVQNQSNFSTPIQYEPVLNNGNSSLPNFQFAIKSWKRLYSCSYCGKQYVDNRSLKSHLIKVHDVNPEPSTINVPRPKEIILPKEVPCSPENLSKPFGCTICGIRYADARSLAGHSLRLHGILTEYHEKWLAQQENPSDYTVEDLLKRHACNSCGKRYSCTKTLRLHYFREHNYVLPLMRGGRRRAIIQPTVNKVTHTGDLQKHMNVCNICGKKYTKNWYLRVHSLEVHGIPMVCGKTKNVKPALRVVKKEIVEEPQTPEDGKTLPDVNVLPVQMIKKEIPERNPAVPVKNVVKVYQCTACEKSFMTITKLRDHCMSRHGIVIPRLRKPYKKANSVNTNMIVNTNSMEGNRNNVKMQVSTPKQVSLDRYFKSPTNGMTIQRVNPIFNPPESIDKIEVRKMPSKEVNIPKEVPVKPITPNPDVRIKCNLCGSICKDIKKHYITYHKIYSTSTMKDLQRLANNGTSLTPVPPPVPPVPPLMTSTAPTSVAINESQSNPGIKRQPPKKRRRKILTMGKKKRRKIDNSETELQISVIEPLVPEIQIPLAKPESPKKESPKSTPRQLKCNICLGIYANPKSLKLHRQKHKEKGETRQNIHLIKHHYKNALKVTPKISTPSTSFNEDLDANMGNDSRTSSNESIITQSSTSDSGDSNRRSIKPFRKSYSASETTCECGRGFRDPHTMYLHKDKCMIFNRIERDKMSLARSSSDRDSGIGISITIKKKNDSYEIVSRDSGDDDKSKDSSISKDSDHMSHSSDSNFSNSVFGDRKFLDLIPAQCSKNHSVLKIEDADDDVDVDIEDDSQTIDSENESINIDAPTTEKKPTKGTLRQEENNTDDNSNRTLDPLDVDLYRCATCLELFKKKDDLTKHMLIHETRIVRQECPCGKTFRGAQTFLTHVEEYHPLWLQCGYCDATFLNSKEYYSHSCDVKQGKEFKDLQEINCNYCLIKVRMLNFESHVNTYHYSAEKPILCYFCKARFKTKRLRTMHVNSEHTKPTCQICGQTLRFDFVAKHEAYHQGFGAPCHVCKKAFSSMKHLKYHRLEVHERDDVKCNICMKTITKKHFKYHMQCHDIKEKCKLCNRNFNTVESLENHIKFQHNDTYPFVKCDTCDATFVKEKLLKKHLAQNLCKKNRNKKKIISKPKIVNRKIISKQKISSQKTSNQKTDEKTDQKTVEKTDQKADEKTDQKADEKTDQKTDEKNDKKISDQETCNEIKIESRKESETEIREKTEREENCVKEPEESPEDENQMEDSEMDESFDMGEPLALEASSDTEGFLEAAESTMNDIVDILETEGNSSFEDAVGSEENAEENPKEKSSENSEETPKGNSEEKSKESSDESSKQELKEKSDENSEVKSKNLEEKSENLKEKNKNSEKKRENSKEKPKNSDAKNENSEESEELEKNPQVKGKKNSEEVSKGTPEIETKAKTQEENKENSKKMSKVTSEMETNENSENEVMEMNLNENEPIEENDSKKNEIEKQEREEMHNSTVETSEDNETSLPNETENLEDKETCEDEIKIDTMEEDVNSTADLEAMVNCPETDEVRDNFEMHDTTDDLQINL